MPGSRPRLDGGPTAEVPIRWQVHCHTVEFALARQPREADTQTEKMGWTMAAACVLHPARSVRHVGSGARHEAVPPVLVAALPRRADGDG